MNLKQFRQHIEKSDYGQIFGYGISEPFSWRGSYDEVAFSILEKPMKREAILAEIMKAYGNLFHGYKGGVYYYNNNTLVNFETSEDEWSNGDCCKNHLFDAVGDCEFHSNDAEMELVELLF